ncbi:MAG: hypothetical protein IJ851_07405 [Eubacterium sp.]|nr:hypothetical protein [Eubacterium sp.]
MKKHFKAVLCLVLALLLTLSFAGCAKVNYISSSAMRAVDEVKSGEWKTKNVQEIGSEDVIQIDELTPGTYGGVEFNNLDDVISFYKVAYDKTKAKTAQYTDENGTVQEWYAFAGSQEIIASDILIDGQSNAVINKLIPQLMDSLYKPSIAGLQPSMNQDPLLDVDENNESLLTLRATADDLLAANVTDNNDGTVTLKMQPKRVEMSHVGLDSQGKIFTSLNDIGAVYDAVEAFTWASGTTDENVKVTYKDGVAEVTIDVASGEIVSATYNMRAYAAVQHANLAVVHDKSATVTVDYIVKFPCDQAFYDKVNVHPV